MAQEFENVPSLEQHEALVANPRNHRQCTPGNCCSRALSVCARHGAKRRDWRWTGPLWWRVGRLGGESPLRALMTGTASRTARASPRGGVRRKLYAKLRPDEQEAHRGDGTRARGHGNLKPKVIRRESVYMRQVDGAKVARLTLGDLPACPRLGGCATGAARRREGAAGVSRGRSSRRDRPTKGQTGGAGRTPAFRWR